jgi:hypothetical protein
VGDEAEREVQAAEAKPQVFSVDFDTREARLTRRRFVDLIAASGAALGIAVAGCSQPGAGSMSASPSPTPAPTPTRVPGHDPWMSYLGTVPPGESGSQYIVDGAPEWAACGVTPFYDESLYTVSCLCDCVSTSGQTCTCNTVCSCDSHSGTDVYWYPN